MKTAPITILAAVVAIASGCTDNQSARNWGGTSTINLEENKKLLNATWKGESLWILTRQMRPGDVAETYEFKEKSSFGLIEGKVVFVETRSQSILKPLKP